MIRVFLKLLIHSVIWFDSVLCFRQIPGRTFCRGIEAAIDLDNGGIPGLFGMAKVDLLCLGLTNMNMRAKFADIQQNFTP